MFVTEIIYKPFFKPAGTPTNPKLAFTSPPSSKGIPLLRLPQNVLVNIVGNLDTIEDVMSLYSTHTTIRTLLRPTVLSRIFIKSPQELDDVFACFNNDIDENRGLTMRQLSIRWSQYGNEFFLLPFKSKRTVTFQDLQDFKNKVKNNMSLMLELYGRNLWSLEVDFPGAFESFQDAGLRFHIPPKQYKSLTRITIGNGGLPLFAGNQYAEFLFCALAAIGENTLQELVIDGGHYSQVNQTIMREKERISSGSTKFRIPGYEMKRRFGFLDKLRQLTIRNLPGFTDPLLYWILSGNEFYKGAMFATAQTAATRLLILDNNPDISAMAVKIVLEGMGRGLGQLQIMLPHQIIEQDPTAYFWDYWHLENEACSEYFEKLREHHDRLLQLKTIEGSEYVDLLDVISKHCRYATESGLVVGKSLDCAVLRPDDSHDICSCATPHLRPRSSSLGSAYTAISPKFLCHSNSSSATSFSSRSSPSYVKGQPRPAIPWTPVHDPDIPPVPEIPAIFKRESTSSTVEIPSHVEEVKTKETANKPTTFAEGVKKLVSSIKKPKFAFW